MAALFSHFFHMEGEIKNLSHECAQALILLEIGWKYRRIGQRINVAQTTFSRVIQ